MQPSIGILLRELTRLYAQASREHVTSGHDTSSTQSHVLIELGRAGLLTQHELGLRLSLDKGWVSRAVESLVQAELVTKSRNDNDRRSRWLQLTPQGNTRYQALNASLDTFAEQLMQPLASAQRSSIHQALLLLLNGLQGQLPADINEAASEVQLALAAAPDASPLTPAAQADAGLEAQAPFIAAAQPALSGHTPESATAAVDSRSNPIDVDSDATPAPALMHEAPAPTLQHDPVASDHTAASTVAQAAAPEPAPQVAAAPPAQAPLAEESAPESIVAQAAPPEPAPRIEAAPPALVHAHVRSEMASEATPKPIQAHGDKPSSVARHGASGSAPNRILGSKTLPTRPLLSHKVLNTPALKSLASVEAKRSSPGASAETPHKVHPESKIETPPVIRVAPHGSGLPAASKNPANPATRNATPLQARPLSVTQPAVREAPPPVKAPSAPAASEPARSGGSLFQKLLSQGSLFNKLLQREPQVVAVEEVVEEIEAEEIDPVDGVLFQQASPSDWNEIRNLLTANRMSVQGALNHLNHFVLATENGRTVGAIGMEIYGDIALVRSLVVASHVRGRAIGKRLVKHLIERARARHLSALYLLTGNADTLFVRYGFEKMPRADLPTKLYVSLELQGPSSSASTGMHLAL